MKRTPLSRSGALALVIACIHLAFSASSAQSPRRIVMVSADRELARAARTALAAWQLDAIAVEDAGLGIMHPDDARLLPYLRAAARAHDADAVVWSTPDPAGDTISVYELASDRILGTRPTPAPPFDAATAAAVILTVKTVLRHSAAETDTPGTPVAEASESGPALPVDSVSSAPPLAAEGGSVRAAETSETHDTAASAWELAAAGGVRSAVTAVDPEARFAAAASLWPGTGALGVAVTVSAGSGFHVRDARLDARLLEPALALAFAARARISADWSAAVSLGPAVHLSWLRGELSAGADRKLDVTRLTPHVHFELHLDLLALPQLRVGLWAQTELALRTQRYWVFDQPALESRRLSLAACLAVSMPLGP